MERDVVKPPTGTSPLLLEFEGVRKPAKGVTGVLRADARKSIVSRDS